MELTICCIAPDLDASTPETLERLILDHLDHDILVFPEYLGQVIPMTPEIYPGRVVVYGSGQVRGQNRVVCAVDDRLLTGSKRYLTPWEKDLTPGDRILFFEFRGVKCAVILCFDVEFPEVCIELKKTGVELLIVPAATESDLGYYRVCRCASARAVELGCAVVTCHLIGHTDMELIDENVGAPNLFLPSQSLFKDPVPVFSSPLSRGPHVASFTVPVDLIREQRTMYQETNPAVDPE